MRYVEGVNNQDMKAFLNKKIEYDGRPARLAMDKQAFRQFDFVPEGF